MLQAGTYTARAGGADEVQFGKTREGNDQLAVPFHILNDGFEGQTITWFANFGSEKAIRFSLEALRKCGWDGANAVMLEGLGSTEVEILVVEEEWDGKLRAKVKFINRPGEGGRVELKNPLDDAGKAAFAAKMKAYMQPATGTRPISPPRAAGAGTGKDGLPF